MDPNNTEVEVVRERGGRRENEGVGNDGGQQNPIRVRCDPVGNVNQTGQANLLGLDYELPSLQSLQANTIRPNTAF
ncbi:UNVERIFIED_CONTAM: hypothetical protein Slati_0018700 [Sesamum latifolium]|uniref:Uncharacterized protein n=1 Tax=Sesamum latifolium TaxID=2727402 RepID=A0AAW2Y6N7_9LAMI